MTRLTKFTLTSAMDKKNYKKLAKLLSQHYKNDPVTDNAKDSETYDAKPDCGIEFLIFKETENHHAGVTITVDIEKLSVYTANPDILEPQMKNAELIIGYIRDAWEPCSIELPFDRFYLSTLTFTSWIEFDSDAQIEEYIRLLNNSILLPGSCRIPTEHLIKAEALKSKSHSKYLTQEDYGIEYFIKPNECLSQDSLDSTDYNIDSAVPTFVIEIKECATKHIDQILRDSNNFNELIECQLLYFMTGAEILMGLRLRKLFLPITYFKKDYVIDSIYSEMGTETQDGILADELAELINGFPENQSLFDWLNNSNPAVSKRNLALLSKLMAFDLLPICVESNFDEANEFLNINRLIDSGYYYELE